MPDTQVMNLVVKYHKAKRKEVALQQRAKQKDEMRAKRGDYQIKVSLRSSEQRTQIIRDYHGGSQRRLISLSSKSCVEPGLPSVFDRKILVPFGSLYSYCS